MAIRVLLGRSHLRCRLPGSSSNNTLHFVNPQRHPFSSSPSSSSYHTLLNFHSLFAHSSPNVAKLRSFFCQDHVFSLVGCGLWDRPHSTDAKKADYSKELNEINSKFAEAREEIELALESKESVYFDEDSEIARSAVKEVLFLFDGLLVRLPEAEKSAVQRSMGLKMEQLKAELAQLDE